MCFVFVFVFLCSGQARAKSCFLSQTKHKYNGDASLVLLCTTTRMAVWTVGFRDFKGAGRSDLTVKRGSVDCPRHN